MYVYFQTLDKRLKAVTYQVNEFPRFAYEICTIEHGHGLFCDKIYRLRIVNGDGNPKILYSGEKRHNLKPHRGIEGWVRDR